MDEENCMIELNKFLEDLNILIDVYVELKDTEHRCFIHNYEQSCAIKDKSRENLESTFKPNLKESLVSLIKCLKE